MDRFFAILCEGVHRFEGTVDKFTGDGIMALFGAPIAHEDHARRACYAALDLQRGAGRVRGRAAPRATGSASRSGWGSTPARSWSGAIGEDLGMDYTAIGHTVGLAQRMESLAEPGKAYLTEHTAPLVEGYFALDDLGEFEVKGASEPLRVHELTGVGAARGRLDVSRARGFSRFVGRDDEMRVLEDALERGARRRGAGDRDRRRGRRRQEPPLPRVRASAAGRRACPSTTSPARRTPSRFRCCRCCR